MPEKRVGPEPESQRPVGLKHERIGTNPVGLKPDPRTMCLSG